MIGPPLAQVVPGGGAGSASSGGTGTLPRLVLPHVEYHLLVPQLALIGSAVVLLALVSLSSRPWRRGTYAAWTLVTGLFAIGWSWHLWGQIVGHHAHPGGLGLAGSGPHAVTAVAHALAVDGFSLFFTMVVSSALVLGALVAESYLPREGLDGPEFYVLAMLCTAGATIMASANDLIVVFLGLEILSISLYVLTGYHFRRMESGEAAIKYFVLGAFSSAFFLYGIALTYGATGSTNLAAIASFLGTNDLSSNGVLLAGLGLLLVGLGFKVAAVPFHVWTPDVYQGAPTPVTGFMAAAAKAAGFAALLRVFLSALGTQTVNWQPLVWVLAALTLVTGAVLAVVQTDVKRMLAYSSIAHAGFVLVGLQAASQQLGGAGTTPAGLSGALFYLLAYTFMVVGTFAVVAVVGGTGDANHDLGAYRGLARRRPALALAFTVLLVAQAGVPFTTGFFAKFYVLSAIVAVGTLWAYLLGVIAMLAAAVAAFFYLRLVLLTWSAPAGEEEEAGEPAPAALELAGTEGGGLGVLAPSRLRVPATLGVAVGLSVAFTVAFGLYPEPIIHLASRATLLF